MVKSLLVKLKQPENQYNLLVQSDYLAGLCVAATLGARDWWLFLFLLATSLILGIITVRAYVKMVKHIVGGEK